MTIKTKSCLCIHWSLSEWTGCEPLQRKAAPIDKTTSLVVFLFVLRWTRNQIIVSVCFITGLWKGQDTNLHHYFILSAGIEKQIRDNKHYTVLEAIKSHPLMMRAKLLNIFVNSTVAKNTAVDITALYFK